MTNADVIAGFAGSLPPHRFANPNLLPGFFKARAKHVERSGDGGGVLLAGKLGLVIEVGARRQIFKILLVDLEVI